MRYVIAGLGALLALLGALWTLQGLGLVAGSFMTGNRLWVVIGLVAVAAGGAVAVRSLRRSRTT